MLVSEETVTLDLARERLALLVAEGSMGAAAVMVTGRPLTPEEAIGTPGRRDYPILLGKERVLEARVNGCRGQAYTDSASEFEGTLSDILALNLATNANRAIFVAVMNAVLKQLEAVEETIHCRDDEPERCGEELVRHLRQEYSPADVALVGLNPALAHALVESFGADRVRVTDLNPDNIGTVRFGVEIWDGASRVNDLARASDVVVITGTTLGNGTFDALRSAIQSHGKQLLVYGVTAVGVCCLLGLPHFCPLGRST
jgi:hypothetical protein